MSALLEVPGLGKATTCAASGSHSPEPLRFVWHHIQPQEAGGPTTPENTAQLCDGCHYSVHRLLWLLRCTALGQSLTAGQQAELDHPPRRAQLELAQRGFAACQAAGTVSLIPDEG